MECEPRIAYFSMEIALDPRVPTYAGGLGVLAGDTIRAAADLKVPLVAVSLAHRKGYFRQRLDASGRQSEEPAEWELAEHLSEVPARVAVTIEGRTVRLRAWRYCVAGIGGASVPVYLLDADLPENSDWDRELTHYLYGGDSHYRLCQEVVLGIGGVRMLRALGHHDISRFHMNEGHAALLTLQLLDERAAAQGRIRPNLQDVAAVHDRCIFTTHTPVAAGHDQFTMDLVRRVLGRRDVYEMKDVFCCEGVLNMTFLAMNLSHFINGVAKRHGEVSQHMFGRYQIDSITNGVHAGTWVSRSFQKLYDRFIPGWRADNFGLRYAVAIPTDAIWNSHQAAKQELVEFVNRATHSALDEDRLTLGFARRATAYKRPDLLFRDVERLRRISREVGPIQVVYGGKAHPRDEGGKELIRRIFDARNSLGEDVPVAYVENYDLEAARLLTAGVDVWLNTPEPPLEASGTSGMKAALNGVPSLSVLDGWWIEGCIEGITGWAIGPDGRGHSATDDGAADAEALYQKLKEQVVPLFYEDRPAFIDIMRHAIALNGSFFNTHRMMQQYVTKAYLL
ncbi:MAG: alpha-glucan family phosphorylase [Planctomycetales bacterium]